MLELLAVGAGGFIGACLRYIITKITNNFSSFPLGTLFSNVIAGFFVGFIICSEQESAELPKKTRLFLTTGMMGGLSTFSTFSMETISLFSAGKYMASAWNVILNLGLSLGGVALGMASAKLLVK